MLERLVPMRDWGDIEVLTMGDLVARLERSNSLEAEQPIAQSLEEH
jgi:hypothetical protein